VIEAASRDCAMSSADALAYDPRSARSVPMMGGKTLRHIAAVLIVSYAMIAAFLLASPGHWRNPMSSR
jgi:hypothetical protein